MTPQTVSIIKSGRLTEYSWKDVTRVEIWRLDGKRSDFYSLELRLTDQEFRLVSNAKGKIWTGASAEELSTFVLHHLDPEKIQDFSLHGPPANLQELECRTQLMIKKTQVRLQGATWLFRIALAGAFLIIPFAFWWPQVFAYSICFGLYALLGRHLSQNCHAKLEKLAREFETQQRELLG